MDNFFTFNTDKYNLWPIYYTISKFYPIGLKRQGAYFQYPGIMELGKIVDDTFRKESPLLLKWKDLCGKIDTSIEVDLIDTTQGQAPSFSAYFSLESIRNENVLLETRLHFSISLLGSFYTIYGTHFAQVFQSEYGGPHKVVSVTTSPHEKFYVPFQSVKQMIEQDFSDYKFVPYLVNEMVVEGLRVRYSDDEVNTVYNALFNKEIFDSNFHRYFEPLGDNCFGMEEWRIEGASEDNDWIIMPQL